MRIFVVAVLLLGSRVAMAACGSGAGAIAPPPTPAPPPPMVVRGADAESEEDEAPRVVYRERVRPRWALVGAGIGIGGAAWLSSAIGTSASGTAWMAIPIAGPIVEATRTNKGAAVVALLSVDVALQIGGVAMAIAGAATRHRAKVAEPSD
jgi:hypothetical protein